MAKSNRTALHESSIDTETNTDDRHHQNSKLGCPECHEMILVGTGRRTSLGQHTGKSKCRQAVKRKQQAKGLRTLFDVGLAHRVAGPVPHPPKMHNPPPVQADVIREDVERDLLGEDMNTTESGELGDAHTATPPTADPAAVKETCPADSIIDVDAADDAAAARTTCPADSGRDIIDVVAASGIHSAEHNVIDDLPAKPIQWLVSMPSAHLKQA